MPTVDLMRTVKFLSPQTELRLVFAWTECDSCAVAQFDIS